MTPTIALVTLGGSLSDKVEGGHLQVTLGQLQENLPIDLVDTSAQRGS